MDELEKKREGDNYNTANEFLVHTAVHTVKGHNNVYEGTLVYIYVNDLYIPLYVCMYVVCFEYK